MAVQSPIPVEKYLRTNYRPDRDYVDGEAVRRNLGEIEHSNAQREIMLYLCGKYPHLRRGILPEQRVQVNAKRFRIPDLCVLREDAPREKIIRTPPVLCIEILSPEDRMPRVLAKVADFLQLGLPFVWVIDPRTRRTLAYTADGVTDIKGGVLSTKDPDIEVPLLELD